MERENDQSYCNSPKAKQYEYIIIIEHMAEFLTWDWCVCTAVAKAVAQTIASCSNELFCFESRGWGKKDC